MRRSLLAGVPLVGALVTALAWMPTAGAASCRVMTLRYAVSGGGFVSLEPTHYDIAFGGCVQFVNQTAATATVTVGAHYSQRLGPNENTSGSRNYLGTTSGRQPVTATSGPGSTPGNTAHGSITVAAAPSHSPSAHPAKHRSHPASPATQPPSSPPSSAGGGPQVAPTPSRTRAPGKHGKGGLQPPVSPAGPVQTLPPSPTSSPAAAGIAQGPVEPASGRGTGLPAALAALAVLGCGAALLRVLAAEPVDSRETVGGRP